MLLAQRTEQQQYEGGKIQFPHDIHHQKEKSHVQLNWLAWIEKQQ